MDAELLPKPVLRASGLSKAFGPTQALADVDFELLRGEIHALCGENGSGKSTLIKILTAYHAPDDGGTLELHGVQVKLPLLPEEPGRHGMRCVHQDLGLAHDLTVLDNLTVPLLPSPPLRRLRWHEIRRQAHQSLERLGVSLNLDLTVAKLSSANQAIVSIARALHRPEDVPPGVLILDEPTAHLPARDISRVMAALGAAAAAEEAVLLVTHRLDEILSYTQRVTVLRDGSRVATLPVEGLTEDRLVHLLLGRELGELYPEPHEPGTKSILRLEQVSGARVTDVSLELSAGEIVGVTGLLGSGYEDLPYLAFGAEKLLEGSIVFDGEVVTFGSPSDAIQAGMGLVPGNRERESGVPTATLTENLTLPSLKSYSSGPLLHRRREDRAAAEALDRYDVRPPGAPSRALSTLSGGNQQKLLLGKWLECSPRVLLLHEPTQGVDIGSRQHLFRLIQQAADDCAILIASSEYTDLASLCHRVLVFVRGRVAADLRGTSLDPDRILEASLTGGNGTRQ